MISGVISVVPKTVYKVEDEEFTKATGVIEHRVAADHQDVATMGTLAARTLMEKLNWSPSVINALIVVTQTPVARMPATACKIAHELGIKCAAFDVNLACSGYVYGLALAASFGGRYTLLIAGDTVSRMVGKEDVDLPNYRLFGDSVTATAVHELRFINARLGTDGAGFDHLIANPLIKMDGLQVHNFALQVVPKLVQDVTMGAHIDLLLMHQANGAMLRHLAKKMKIPDGQMPISIERWGNCSSASIPLTMCSDPTAKQLMERRNRVCMIGMGAGWSFGGLLMDLDPLVCCEVIEC